MRIMFKVLKKVNLSNNCNEKLKMAMKNVIKETISSGNPIILSVMKM